MIKKGSIIHDAGTEWIALNDETETEGAKIKCTFDIDKESSVGDETIFTSADIDIYNAKHGPHPQNTSTINHPPHYGGESNPYEAIKVIEAWGLGFHLGNVVKYISRCGKKNPDKIEDLEKSLWYLERELKNEKNV